ncbi:MAG: Mrp/NBP35 family ATP-binding protein [bacterium]|nr:Mrp/NBP35 family ATP-binding protein [bacterium]
MKEDKDLTPEEKQRMDQFKQKVAAEMRIDERMSKIKNKILVASGKGGVGKTTVAVNLAVALAERGHNVGILDADIHGPSVDKATGVAGAKLIGEVQGIRPAIGAGGVRVMSMGLLIEDDSAAVIWRGPMKMSMIDTMLADVDWGELDYFIIDTPPGTGDEILSLGQRIKNLDGLIMVTTPQEASILSAKKSISFARAMNIPALGVIENMGPFPCPHCGEPINLFSTDRAKALCDELDVPYLGTIPFDAILEDDALGGKPAVVAHPDAPGSDAILDIAKKIEKQLG